MELTKHELEGRRKKFCAAMDAAYPAWDTAIFCGKVNQYYFTGTMQDAILLVYKNGDYAYFVRKSYARAREESPLEQVFPMQSYREAAHLAGAETGNTFMELDTVPYAMIERIRNYFEMESLGSLERVTDSVRAVKTAYELYWMEQAGAQLNRVMLEGVPSILREGMSEAEFSSELLGVMGRYGYHGITRFHKFQTEIIGGQIAFGENSVYPTCFDGPGGTRGMSAATPIAGHPGRTLQKGDLVFVDLGFGINGYHSDKTQLFSFGAQPGPELAEAHRFCMEIENRLGERMAAGAIPSEIYLETMAEVPEQYRARFMGVNGENVKFLGHGVGLYMDELPVIAQGFDAPLETGMTVAVEPKISFEGVGMVGVEDMYVVEPGGARCISGGGREIIVV